MLKNVLCNECKCFKLSFFAQKTNTLIGATYMYINGAQTELHPLLTIVPSAFWFLADWTKPLFTDEIFERGF